MFALRVSDGDGGEAFQSFSVEVDTDSTETIPEPSLIIIILSFSILGLSARIKDKVPSHKHV